MPPYRIFQPRPMSSHILVFGFAGHITDFAHSLVSNHLAPQQRHKASTICPYHAYSSLFSIPKDIECSTWFSLLHVKTTAPAYSCGAHLLIRKHRKFHSNLARYVVAHHSHGNASRLHCMPLYIIVIPQDNSTYCTQFCEFNVQFSLVTSSQWVKFICDAKYSTNRSIGIQKTQSSHKVAE
jgi:hypothetical protein